MCKATDFPSNHSDGRLKNFALVIYDGNCNFCQSQIDLLKRLDLGHKRLRYLSLHDPSILTEFPQLDHERLMQEMHLIDHNGKCYAGSEAVKYLTRTLPLLWAAAPIIHLPCTSFLWRWLYKIIAKNRYLLAGKNCDSGGCKLD